MLVSVGSRFVASDHESPRYSLLARMPLHDALVLRHDDDAHAYLYHDPEALSTPRHADSHPSPRLDALLIDTIFADIDNPSHERWSSPEAACEAVRAALDVARTSGAYATSGGYRLVQPLAHALPVLEAEAATRVWHVDLERRGILVDHSTTQWTRCYRLPHVRRDGRDYTPPIMDLTRMVPIAAPTGGFVARRPKRGGPLVDVQQLDEVPTRWRELAAELQPAIAAEPTGIADGWHMLALRVCGTALGMGLRPEHARAWLVAAYPAGADRANLVAIADSTARRYASRKPVQGKRALVDVHPRIAAIMLGETKREPARVPPSLPAAAEASAALLEDLRQVRPGLRLVRAACGVGKTRAARIVAAERAAEGLRTMISVPTHELASQVVRDLRAEGVEVLHVRGPLSVRLPDGSPACRWHVQASRLAEGRQSVRAMLCGTCEYAPDCTARDPHDGPRKALVGVGVHAMLRSLVAMAGSDGLLVIDEPPPVTEQLTLRREHLVEIEPFSDRFEPGYMRHMRPAISLVDWWLQLDGLSVRDGARGGEVYHLSRALDLTDEHGAAAARAGLEAATSGQDPPAMLADAARRTKFDAPLAAALGRVSHTLDVLRRSMLSLEARARVESIRGDEQRRMLAITLLREDLALALRRDGPTVVAAADVDIHEASYRRVSTVDVPVTAYAACDGAPVDRTQLALKATRSRWLPLPTGGDIMGPAYEAIALALVWLEEQPWRRAGLVVYSELATRLRGSWRELVPDGLEVRHYGALRGLDSWRDYDALITLGDPHPPVDHVERELLLLGLDAGSDAVHARSAMLAAAELEQAHGRLRAPHRARPARALHVGRVTPRGWVGHRELSAPEHDVITPDEVRRIVDAEGGIRAVGRLMGCSPASVHRWTVGESRPRTDHVVWLRTRSGLRSARTEGVRRTLR